jgi:predicted metal-dependent peptidase
MFTTFRRPSRSSINQDCKVIRPSTYSVTPTVVIVVDTSGSMGSGSRSRLERALSECEAILKIGKVKSYFLDCDANVYGKAQEVRSLRNAKVHGGGGTDMRIGVLAAKRNKPKPDVVVLLTDGETPWPEAHEVRDIKIITAICNEREISVPHYMNPIWVDDE